MDGTQYEKDLRALAKSAKLINAEEAKELSNYTQRAEKELTSIGEEIVKVAKKGGACALIAAHLCDTTLIVLRMQGYLVTQLSEHITKIAW